jgi:hypothetical protein
MPALNASDRKSIRSAEKASALRTIQDREAVAAIMSTIPGRAWMWRMLKQASLFNSNFTGDPYRDAFLAGERNFGLRMLNDIMEHCPDAYLQMTKEANNDRHDGNDRSPGDTDPDADPLAQRPSRSLANGGDSGQDSGSAEGSIADSPEAGGWNLLNGQVS